jgi:branched-chain amino acid transport system substrate-binding protein
MRIQPSGGWSWDDTGRARLSRPVPERPTQPPGRHRSRTSTLLALAVAAVMLAGCGSRLSQSAIDAAARKPIVNDALPQKTDAATAIGTAATSSMPVGNGLGSSSSPGAPAGSPQAAGAASSHVPSGAATAGSTSTASAQAAGSTISLGNVGSYSGVIGAVFAGAEPALGVWQDYVNAHGGLNGHPVHIYFADDGGDPSTSVSEVEQEVTQDHVIAFVGNFYPLTVSASEPYLLQQDIPVIGGDSNANEWWQSPVLFPQGSGALNPSVEAEFTIGAAVARGYTKMAVLYCVEDPGCATTVSAFEKPGTAIDGATTVYSSSISLTQPDFTAQCIAAKQAGATFVYFAGDSDSLNRMVGDCVAQGYNPIYDIDSLAVTSDLINDPHLDGLLAGQSDFPWVDSFTPAQTTYQQAMKTYDPGLQGSASTAAEWTAGMLAVAADKDITSTPTSAEIFQGLWSIKDDNLGGLAPPLTFTQNAPATPSYCFFLMTIQNQQFVDLNNGNSQCVS